MGKYSNMKILKKTKARSHHVCHKCGKEISPSKIYYRECVENRFLGTLHSKKYCSSCYEKYGGELLKMKKSKRHKNTEGMAPLDKFEK